jgi:hypothetical protein
MSRSLKKFTRHLKFWHLLLLAAAISVYLLLKRGGGSSPRLHPAEMYGAKPCDAVSKGEWVRRSQKPEQGEFVWRPQPPCSGWIPDFDLAILCRHYLRIYFHRPAAEILKEEEGTGKNDYGTDFSEDNRDHPSWLPPPDTPRASSLLTKRGSKEPDRRSKSSKNQCRRPAFSTRTPCQDTRAASRRTWSASITRCRRRIEPLRRTSFGIPFPR